MVFEQRTTHPDVGVEVLQTELKGISDADFAEIRTLIAQHGFALFRNQQLDAHETVELARRFGEPLPGYRPEFTHPAYPELVQLGNIRENGRTVTYLNTQGIEWHTDGTGAVLPPNVSMLYALEAPSRGGETLFASATKGYARLPAELKVKVDGLKVINSFDHHNDRVADFSGTNVVPRQEQLRQRNPDKTEALVQVHPKTGTQHLFVTHQMVKEVIGYERAAGAALIMSLVQHMTQPENVYAHQWRANDLIVFDNRSSIHSATPYDYADQRRLMYQVIIGERQAA